MERLLNIHDDTRCKFEVACPHAIEDATAPLRKSISHVFGRNKTCTRAIADHVWLKVCRKHYQRGRYRETPDGHAMRMLQNIEMQFLRIEAWSRENFTNKTPEDGIVECWEIKLRKRQEYLKEESEESAKEEEEDAPKPKVEDCKGKRQEPSSRLTPVPHWVRKWLGKNKSATTVQHFLVALYTEMIKGRLAYLPEFELLPTITGENTKPSGRKRKRPAQATEAAPSERPSKRVATNHVAANHDHTVHMPAPQQGWMGTSPPPPLPRVTPYTGGYQLAPAPQEGWMNTRPFPPRLEFSMPMRPYQPAPASSESCMGGPRHAPSQQNQPALAPQGSYMGPHQAPSQQNQPALGPQGSYMGHHQAPIQRNDGRYGAPGMDTTPIDPRLYGGSLRGSSSRGTEGATRWTRPS
jgi:hypothetical protein